LKLALLEDAGPFEPPHPSPSRNQNSRRFYSLLDQPATSFFSGLLSGATSVIYILSKNLPARFCDTLARKNSKGRE